MAGIFSKYPLKDDATSVKVRAHIGGCCMRYCQFPLLGAGAGKLERRQSRHLFLYFTPLIGVLYLEGTVSQVFPERQGFLGRGESA